MLYIHGGGYLIGSPEGADEVIKRFIDRRPCIVIAPDYRKAYERPYPAGFQDCYDTLLWVGIRRSDSAVAVILLWSVDTAPVAV